MSHLCDVGCCCSSSALADPLGVGLNFLLLFGTKVGLRVVVVNRVGRAEVRRFCSKGKVVASPHATITHNRFIHPIP